MVKLINEYNGDARWKPSRDTIDLIFKWVDNSETKNPHDLEDLYGISDYDVKYSDSSKTTISIYAAMDFTVNGEEYRCDETFYIQPDYNRDTYKMYSDELGMRTVESTTDVLDLIAVTLNDGRKKYMKELQRIGEKTESIKRNSRRSIKEELDYDTITIDDIVDICDHIKEDADKIKRIATDYPENYNSAWRDYNELKDKLIDVETMLYELWR